jgi:16S rRNA (cytosine1402-N4)-methyltransferase
MAVHVPVMVREVVEALQCHDGSWIVDGTLGLGGYAREILKASAPGGGVMGCDVDPAALEIAQQNLKEFGDRLKVVRGSYADIAGHLKNLNRASCSGICIDIGVSSLQIDTDERGFSFQREGPLDMRMNPDISQTAADLVNTASAEELAQWFWEYGEERFSRKIAAALVGERSRKPFTTTTELADCVKGAVPKPARYGRIHPATRVFQALRIVVNDELGELKQFLATAPECLSEGGRVVVVSYHSLEDRLVKQSWKQRAETKKFKLITKKPLVPSEDEVQENPRARSAKMRVLERVGSLQL